MKRIFIAVKVVAGNTLLKMVSSLKGKLSDDNIKWTSIDNIHITLAFLGNTPEDKIESIDDVMKVKCSEFKKFEVGWVYSGELHQSDIQSIELFWNNKKW